MYSSLDSAVLSVGSVTAVTVTVADVLAIPEVVASAYYSDVANWKRVVLRYTPPVGEGFKCIDLWAAPGPVVEGSASLHALAPVGTWTMSDLVIYNKDGQCLRCEGLVSSFTSVA